MVLRPVFVTFRAALFAFSCFLLSGVAAAQTGYGDELGQLASELRALMIRAERVDARDHQAGLEIQEQLLNLSKKLHRLEEEALATNVRLFRQGHPPDRNLLLAASIAKSLDLAQSLVANFLDTRDKVFWSQALTAAQSARTLLAATR